MNAGESLYQEWCYFTAASTGKILPITGMCIEDDGSYSVMYEVPASDAPLQMVDGSMARVVALSYEFVSVRKEDLL